MTPEKKERIWELLNAGKRSEAIRYAEGAFGIDAQKAEELVEAVDREKNPGPGWRIDPASIVGKAFALIGSIFLVVVATLYYSDAKSTSKSIRITGKVVTLHYDGRSAVPVVQYQYLGKQREYEGTVWSSPPAYDVGDEVDLLVDTNNEQNVVLDSFLERYFLMLLFGILGTVFGGVGLVVLRLRKRA